MANTLTTGLSDLSSELGESNTNTTTRRIKAYNDAVQDFANERKWPFLTKRAVLTTTQSGVQYYSLSSLTDRRMPGDIKEVFIGDDSSDNRFQPIKYEERHDPLYDGQKVFWVDDELDRIYFKKDIATAGDNIVLRYWYVPARIEDTASQSTFPIPDRFRKTVAILAAAYVQYSRYLDQQGNRLMNLYNDRIGKTTYQQSENHRGGKKKLQHYLQYRGFRRRYP